MNKREILFCYNKEATFVHSFAAISARSAEWSRSQRVRGWLLFQKKIKISVCILEAFRIAFHGILRVLLEFVYKRPEMQPDHQIAI